MLKVGLILDEGKLPYIAHDLITRSNQAEFYKVDCLIIQRINQAHGASAAKKVTRLVKSRGLFSTVSLLSFLALEYVEKWLISTKSVYRSVFSQVDLNTVTMDTLECNPEVSVSGLVYRYNSPDLDKIGRRGLDVLVRCGSGILRGEILNVCPFGIVSIHHGDNNRYRGGPPGFWEVFHRRPDTGFIIQLLTEELDGGNVLLRGSIPTAPIATLNKARLILKANVFLHRQLEIIGKAGSMTRAHSAVPYCHPLYTIPGFAIQFTYVLNCIAYLVKRITPSIVRRQLQWGVAYQYVDQWQDTVLWRATEIRNPAGRFFADPAIIRENEQTICFVEDYHYADKKAKITAIAVNPDGYTILGTALKEDFHLSYPCVFRHDGEIYMCPETRSISEIRLYRCTNFPLQWKLHKVLLKNIDAVDTNVVEHNGTWWLFTNQDSAGMDDFGSELHLYSADSLEAEEWTAHPKNPVVFNSLSGRNGGMINDQKRNFRVSQAQGFDLYGEGASIHEIHDLDPRTYNESAVGSISAKYAAGIRGVHTFNFCDGVVVFDRLAIGTIRK